MTRPTIVVIEDGPVKVSDSDAPKDSVEKLWKRLVPTSLPSAALSTKAGPVRLLAGPALPSSVTPARTTKPAVKNAAPKQQIILSRCKVVRWQPLSNQ